MNGQRDGHFHHIFPHRRCEEWKVVGNPSELQLEVRICACGAISPDGTTWYSCEESLLTDLRREKEKKTVIYHW
jgi:hypothetical protein